MLVLNNTRVAAQERRLNTEPAPEEGRAESTGSSQSRPEWPGLENALSNSANVLLLDDREYRN